MLIIIDSRMPQQAKHKLSRYGEILEFSTSGITYDAISGHPDVFFCKIGSGVVIAPNTPNRFVDKIAESNLPFIRGFLDVGLQYPASAYYNACCDDTYFIHNLNITEPVLKQQSLNLKSIHVFQGYARCSTINCGNNSFITSDVGVYKTLSEHSITSYLVNPEAIFLEGFKHGFFGGCCGFYNQKLFVNGSLKQLKDSKALYNFISDKAEIVELYDGPLVDVGSIIFLG